MSNLQKGKGSTASPPAVANRVQQPNQRGPTPPNRGQEDYSSRNSQGYQQGGMPQVMYAQGMIQQNPQQGQQQRLTSPYYRGTRPMRMPHAQTPNQPMFPSPTVSMVPLSSGGGPQQYAVSPQQYPQVDYQVPNQPMAYRSQAQQIPGYNQVAYQNYSPSASIPPPLFVTQAPRQNVFVTMPPPMPQNIPGPPQYPQSRPEQHATAPRQKKIIQIRDPNQDNKDVTEEILSQSATNSVSSGSPGPGSESVSGQSSTSNTPPQENASKNSESLGSVFAAQVAATLTVESDSTKKTKPIIQVVMPSHMVKSTSPKAVHPDVRIISIEKNSRTVQKDHKKDEAKIEVEKQEVKPPALITQPKKPLDTEDSLTSVVDSAKISTEAKNKDSTEISLENQINANKDKAVISKETVPFSTSIDSMPLGVTNAKPNIEIDVLSSDKPETMLRKEELSLESQEHKVDTENLPNGSISPLTVSEEIVQSKEICQELEMIPPAKDIPESDITTSKEEASKEENVSEVETETSSDSVAKASEPMAQANIMPEEGKVNGVESQTKAKQTAAPTTELSMKENKRKKLGKRLKEIDKKPAQADILDAFTEAPPPKEVVKEEPKEEKKEEKEEQVPSEEETWEEKDEKSEGMWSPEPEPEENKNGPRFYDRDFLLQFQFNPICTEKPDGLPDIEVVLQTPVSHRPQLKQPYSNRMGGGGGVDFMMPSYMRQPRGLGSGQSMPRSNKGRMPAKKVIHTIEQKVELNKSENRWVRPAEAAKNLNEEEKKTEDILRKFRGILNKLTPQKFGTLIQQVLDLEIDTPERLEYVINIIFEKAISEPGFSVAYANMCRYLVPTNVKVETKDGKDTTLTFRKILLNKCQKEFEKEKTDEINIHSKMDELLKQGLSDEELKLKKEELDEEELKGRRRTLGNIRFIGELFKLKMLTESIMHDCIIKLLKSNDEESYECLCKLLSTIGKDLDHPKAKPRMDQYFDKVQKIIETKKTSSRCRFMLQDVIDLRENNWVPRRDDNNPKTIDQIHKEAAEEEKKTMILIQQTKLHKRDGLSKGRDGSRPGGVPQADEAWTTVPARQRNVSVDPKKFQDVKKRTNVDTESISLGPGGRGFGAWARGSSGGSGPPLGPSAPTEEPRGNRYSALGGEGRRGPGVSRQGSGAGRQESRGQNQAGRRPQNEREKALEAVRSVVQTKGQQQSKQEGRQTPSPRPDEGLVAPFPRPDSTPTPPPKLTEEEFESKTMGLIHEYHNIKDIKEAIQCVKDINCPEMHYKFVYFALNHSMEKHAFERVLTAELLHALLQSKIISEESYIKGLEDILEFAEDMEIDIPHIWKYLGELIGVTITANVLSLTSLNKSIDKYIRDKSKAAKLMAEILISARCGLDPKEIDRLWFQSGLSFRNYFSSEEEEMQFLKSNKLESLAGGSSNSTNTQPHSSKIQEELRNLILIRKSSNEVVFSWIDSYVRDTKDPKFIRALVTVICESCKKDSEDSCDIMAFKNRSPLLQKYIDNNISLELHALFALQALSANLDHPPGFLKSFFNALYDEEAISEEAFFAWEEDTNPNESYGKGAAKASTVHFFEWLRSAEEEKAEES